MKDVHLGLGLPSRRHRTIRALLQPCSKRLRVSSKRLRN